MAKKLTKSMLTVLEKMADGWQLLSASNGKKWIQKGRSIDDVHSGTFRGLVNRKLVTVDRYFFPTITWKLKEQDG